METIGFSEISTNNHL